MPLTLRLNDGSFMRRSDVHTILHYLEGLRCVEVIGFSNIGKSAFLQLLAEPDVWTMELGEAGSRFMPVYVDCNRMLHLNDQGFYELVLRCLQESYPELAALPELTAAYNTLIAPGSEFHVPLSFNRGLTAALESTKRKLILLFDEFDEPFSVIDGRVFINLRALQDRHNTQLAYVTATVRPLTQLRLENHCSEFCELFSLRSWHLAPLVHDDVVRQIRRYMEAFEVKFTSTDIDFIFEWAGGHPRMLDGVCRILGDAVTNAPPEQDKEGPEHWQLHKEVVRTLRTDEFLTRECSKIWDECSPEERKELMALGVADHTPNADVVNLLVRRHILLRSGNQVKPFCRLLAEFIRRQSTQDRPSSAKLWVDVDSGEVLVSGKPIDTLTGLEYKLMLFFYQNADKIIDKYQIVTQVWGESYIDEVDDARIEKLISRLRQKVEPDPTSPRYLTTVRGRGYRLVLA
ncbi:MAG: winged helix-turn-helix domain-containing protein [Caldilineaceae bacterium]